MDFAFLLLRIVVGALFVGHGTQKLFGWFGGPGLEGTGQFFEQQLGYRPGRRHALMAGLAETTAGAMLVLGLLVPFAAAGIIGVMVNAIGAVHAPNGLWVDRGGYEYNLVLITVAVALAWGGPGTLAVTGLGGPFWAVAALGLGLTAGLLLLGMREAALEAARQEARSVDLRDDGVGKTEELVAHR